MTRDLFLHWFTNHFLLYAPQIRPLLLLLDGHSTHYSPETINIAAQNQVIVFALPPHTTHIAHPLDHGCFAPLKTAWRQLCHKFITDNPGRTVTQYDFSQLFSKAWSAAFSIHNITSSFKVTGVYPFDRSVFTEANAPENKEEEQFSLFNPDALARRTGLAYIPLYSPAIKKRPSATSTPFKSEYDTKLYEASSDGLGYKPTISFSDSELLLHANDTERNFREGSLPTMSTSILSNFLPPLKPPNKVETKRIKSAGVVLTSRENLEIMNEKQRKKQLEIERKEERKRLREEKAKLKAKGKKQSKYVIVHRCV